MSKTPLFDAAIEKLLSGAVPHTRVCEETGESFEITAKDIEMCRLLKMPLPKTVWWARMRQKRSFLGGFDLFRRSLPDGRSIVTMYDPESFATFIPSEEWYSDTFDPFSYGIAIDPTQPFLTQWDLFSHGMPRAALMTDAKSVGSEWSIYYLNLKNGYNCWGTWDSEDILYADQTLNSKHSSDLSLSKDCEWCYDSVMCKKCARVSYSERCQNSMDLLFCLACRNCSDCFGSTNLRNKRFVFLNEQLDGDEYKKRIAEIDLTDATVVEAWRTKIHQDVWNKAIRCGESMTNVQNAVGDDIENSRDVYGVSVFDSERVYHCMLTWSGKDCYDSIGGLKFELCANDLCSVESSNMRMDILCLNSINLEYSEFCDNCEDCFGCIGLRHKKFCIFNRQYTEEEYWPLVDAIKTAMLERGEYGDFFPHQMNPIAFNASHAMALWPTEEQEARRIGMRWYSFNDEKNGEASAMSELPQRLVDTTDAILDQKFRCPATSRIFRYVKPELDFHRTMNLALPRVHPSIRRYGRAAQQFAMRLHHRSCDKCGAGMQSRIPDSHKGTVYCQKCYEELVTNA